MEALNIGNDHRGQRSEFTPKTNGNGRHHRRRSQIHNGRRRAALKADTAVLLVMEHGISVTEAIERCDTIFEYFDAMRTLRESENPGLRNDVLMGIEPVRAAAALVENAAAIIKAFPKCSRYELTLIQARTGMTSGGGQEAGERVRLDQDARGGDARLRASHQHGGHRAGHLMQHRDRRHVVGGLTFFEEEVMKNNNRNSHTRDDDYRRLVVGLDEVTVGLCDLETARTLDDHPEIQCDLRSFAGVVRRAANFLADLREQEQRR